MTKFCQKVMQNFKKWFTKFQEMIDSVLQLKVDWIMRQSKVKFDSNKRNCFL